MTKILHQVGIAVIIVFCKILLLASVTIFSQEALAQSYPTKPIRLIVTTSPGAGADIMARLIGAKLAESFGQQVVVDNRSGAGGRIGTENAARSTPDGYTLVLLSSSHTVNDAVYKDLNYNLVKDFSPISLLSTNTFIFVVNASVTATSVNELVTVAKSRPGALKYGSAGSGTASHLSAEMFKFMTNTDILHVPYKGAIPPLTNTMTGEVDMTFHPITACLPMIKSGKIRALGVTSSKRTPLAPDLPSISESVPGYEYIGWYGLFAPIKTPPAILSKLNAEVIKALNTSAVRERMVGLGNEVLGTSQQELALHLNVQLEKMREAVKLSGVSPQEW